MEEGRCDERQHRPPDFSELRAPHRHRTLETPAMDENLHAVDADAGADSNAIRAPTRWDGAVCVAALSTHDRVGAAARGSDDQGHRGKRQPHIPRIAHDPICQLVLGDISYVYRATT